MDTETALWLTAQLAETERLLELVRGNPAMAAGMEAMRDKLRKKLDDAARQIEALNVQATEGEVG